MFRALSVADGPVHRLVPWIIGTLLATGFMPASQVGEPGGDVVKIVAQAFRRPKRASRPGGKAVLGDRTIVDGLQAVCPSLQPSSTAGIGLVQALRGAAEVTSTAAGATAAMEPRKGRASGVSERATRHQDTGCVRLAVALRAVAESAAG